jgi:hypothetical protein
MVEESMAGAVRVVAVGWSRLSERKEAAASVEWEARMAVLLAWAVGEAVAAAAKLEARMAGALAKAKRAVSVAVVVK